MASADETPVYSQVVENGGDILVRAGNDIVGGAYFLGRGQGRIEAGGSILKGEPVAGTQVETGLILGLMDGQWSAQSTGDMSLSAIYNPTMLAFASAKGGVSRQACKPRPPLTTWLTTPTRTMQACR